MPFFLEPRWDVVVDVGKYGKKKYGVWAIEKMTMFFEHKHMLDKLRQIPEYADAKGPLIPPILRRKYVPQILAG